MAEERAAAGGRLDAGDPHDLKTGICCAAESIAQWSEPGENCSASPSTTVFTDSQ